MAAPDGRIENPERISSLFRRFNLPGQAKARVPSDQGTFFYFGCLPEAFPFLREIETRGFSAILR